MGLLTEIFEKSKKVTAPNITLNKAQVKLLESGKVIVVEVKTKYLVRKKDDAKFALSKEDLIIEEL